jgi:hypothetical protein
MPARIGTKEFVASILEDSGGISASNLYEFQIQWGLNAKADADASPVGPTLKQFYFAQHGEYPDKGDEFKCNLLCNEIQIPGVTYAAMDVKSVHKGITQKLVSNKVFNEFDVSFYCDQDSTPYKLFRTWMDAVMGANVQATDALQYTRRSSIYAADHKAFVLSYYDDYTCDIIINKLEKQKAKDTKSPGTYSNDFGVRLKKAYPYTMASVPYSAGPTQLVKVTVGFYYEYSSMRYER